MKYVPIFVVLILLAAVGAVSRGAPPPSTAPAAPVSLSFRNEKPADSPGITRTFEGSIPPVRDVVYVYATLQMGPANPVRFVDGLPEWRPAGAPAAAAAGPTDTDTALGGFVVQEQKEVPPGRRQFLDIVALGQQGASPFVPLVRFGFADDRRAQDHAHVTPWVSDGHTDYFGPFARPETPWDFRLRIDLKRHRLTAWVSGRGDDDWFLLAEDVRIAGTAQAIDHVQAEMTPDSPPISGLRVVSQPWEPGETVRPHPLAKPDRVVGPERGFHFQSLRSTWRQPGKHVTIFREPGEHAGFPDVAQAGPEHLVCVWRNGSHTGGTGGLSIAHSHDLGRTWSGPEIVTRLPGNCPRLQRLRDGSLLLLVDVPSGGDQFTAAWDLVLWDSTDEGKTWINERRLDAGKVGGGGCIVPSRICELADGSWLLAASYFRKPEAGGYEEILDYYWSEDRGTSWQFIAQPQHYPPYNLSEPSPIELSDGTLVVYARESRADGMPGAKGVSLDGGKTWQYQELPHPITGRTCANRLRDGRVLNTFRSGVGRAALRAWIGEIEDQTTSQPAGGHFNDRFSVGLRDGALHIDNDGRCGQFTKYSLRPADSRETTVDLTFEVQVLENQGRAATVSIPFAGKLRIFPDHAVFAHDPNLRIAVTPGEFHTWHVVSRAGRTTIEVDGKLALDTDKADGQLQPLPWVQTSSYALEFGNEAMGHDALAREVSSTRPDVYLANITPAVTGCSLWRRFESTVDDPAAGRHATVWVAARDDFPDQYQLDHIVEVEASVNGHDQGYSGWTQLDDGRIFVVHYTDDTAGAIQGSYVNFGIPWIRGTFLELSDLPPVAGDPQPVVLSEAHQAAVRRPRRIYVNNDVGLPVEFGLEVSDWVVLQFDLFDEPGIQVDSIGWCFDEGNIAAYPSRVIPVLQYPNLRKWHEAGIDIVRVAVAETHKRNKEAFFVHRLNGHDMKSDFSGYDHAPLKQQHPEWVLDGKHWNFAMPGVRTHKLAILRELAENYDFDGIDIDFSRSPPNLPVGQQWLHREAITDFMRQVRQMCQQVSLQRGRPLLLAARLPETVAGCHYDGIDIETWTRENLLDIIGVGGRSINLDIAGYRRVIGSRNIRLMPSLDDYHSTDGYRHPGIEFWRGVYGNWWHQGIDGAQTFNFFTQSARARALLPQHPEAHTPPGQQQALREIGDPQAMQFKDALYVLERRYGEFGSDWAIYHSVNAEAPLPVELQSGGRPAIQPLYVGDDLNASRNRIADVRLSVLCSDTKPGDVIEARFNGILLAAPEVPDDGWRIFALTPRHFAVGANLISLRLAQRSPADQGSVSVEKVEVMVDYQD